MSILPNAHRPVIEGGQLTTVHHGDAHIHVGDPKAGNTRGLKLLRQNVATGGFYDAAERGDPPKCHPHTRLAVLTEIQKWVRDPEVRKGFITWLYGPAGAGKTAIAQTLAEIFAREHILVASFFFSRTGTGRNNTARFVASIAYQLSLSIPEIRMHIAAAVEQDPHVFSRTLLSQMKVLIIEPLNAAGTPANPGQPRLIIVDGLDEVREEKTQKELLEALAAAIQQLHVPIIFLVASRPECGIRHAFNRQPLQSLMQGLALDEDYKDDDDISTFISAGFDEIRESHPSGDVLPESWPSQKDVDYLVGKASGQFIYASTVMKYISSPRDNPKTQLKIILGLSDPGKDTPFAQLDALYIHILSSVKDISRVLEILALIFLQNECGDFLSISFIETILEYDSGDVAAALTDMHALVHVPSSNDRYSSNRLHIYHASLHDFLLDKSRSERFFLDASVRHADLARHLLRYITTTSKSEDEDRFRSITNEFMGHYIKAPHTDQLVADLNKFSLTTFLSHIPLDLFYVTAWDAFFDHLRCECGETNTALYRRLIEEFDNWIRSQFERYPEYIRTLISAAHAIPGNYIHAVVYLPDIFDILTHSLSHSDATLLRKLDKELFQFQDALFMTHASCNDRSTLQNFFCDPSRAGVHVADEVKFGKLAEEIVKVLCRRGENCLEIMVEDRQYSNDVDSSKSEWFYTLKIQYGDLKFFPHILGAASDNLDLAQFLWERAVQYKKDDPISEGRKIMADACLDYIKRCGIYIPEHIHGANCTMCANYKPVFSRERPPSFSISILADIHTDIHFQYAAA